MTIFKQKDELNYDVVLSELEKWKIDTRLYVAHKYNFSIEIADAKATDIILGNIKEDFSQRMDSDNPAFWMLIKIISLIQLKNYLL